MSAAADQLSASRLLEGLLAGQTLAISRAITAIENGAAVAPYIIQAVQQRVGRARSIGVTGPPGAGKSSLINALISEFASRVRNIGVLTVDPSSAFSGGALLGDRVRMARHSTNPRVFIRSLASRGHLGGLTRMTGAVMDVLSAAGMDLIIVETVGTGQSEIQIGDLANVTLVLWPPGLGDDMQAIKSGILEIADILVVNKADLPGAQQTAMQLRAMLDCKSEPDPRPVILTDAASGVGLRELTDAIEMQFSELKSSVYDSEQRHPARARAALALDCAAWVQDAVSRSEDPRLNALSRDVEASRTTRRDAIRNTLRLVLDAAEGDLHSKLQISDRGDARPNET